MSLKRKWSANVCSESTSPPRIRNSSSPPGWRPGMPSVLFCLGNFTPKTSNYCLKNRALGFTGTYRDFIPYDCYFTERPLLLTFILPCYSVGARPKWVYCNDQCMFKRFAIIHARVFVVVCHEHHCLVWWAAQIMVLSSYFYSWLENGPWMKM